MVLCDLGMKQHAITKSLNGFYLLKRRRSTSRQLWHISMFQKESRQNVGANVDLNVALVDLIEVQFVGSSKKAR